LPEDAKVEHRVAALFLPPDKDSRGDNADKDPRDAGRIRQQEQAEDPAGEHDAIDHGTAQVEPLAFRVCPFMADIQQGQENRYKTTRNID
jgi:hypothetical protein